MKTSSFYIVAAALLTVVPSALSQAAATAPKTQSASADGVKISASVATGMLLQRTPPTYPPVAKAARVSGTVVLAATISPIGKIEDIQVISGPALLQGAALDAVRTWVYRPYTANGVPAAVQTTINILFTLDDYQHPDETSSRVTAPLSQLGSVDENSGEQAYLQQHYEEALPHFQAAASAGNKDAFSYLGYMYRFGRGVPVNLQEAEAWFAKSVAAGNTTDNPQLIGVRRTLAEEAAAQATQQASTELSKSPGTTVPGPSDAEEQLATQRYFDAEEQFATQTYFQQHYEEALPHFQAAASAGNKDAFSYLGYMYRFGRGVPVNLQEAEAWFAKSVAAGNTTDNPQLIGVRRTLAEEAAAQNIQAAQERLAQQREREAEQQRLAQQQQLARQQEAQQQEAQQRQVAEQEPDSQEDSDRQEKISQLRSDIESQSQFAENDENSANQLLNNCSGPGAALCQALGQAGAARLRQKAAEARNQADSDREEIERLQGEEVQNRQRRDTTYGGSLQQVTTETGTSIQSAAAQQQANLQALAAANQQRQHAQAQQPTPSMSAPVTRSSSVDTATAVPATTASPGPAPSSSGNNPYSSAPAQGTYNPYSGTGSGSIQGSCTDMTGSVQGTVKIGSDGWVSGYLTNNSNQLLYVSYTFKQNGVPSTAMANAGGTTIQGGQTVGGEGQGLYSTGADKNPPQIYWYAVLKSEHDKYGCVHKW